MKRTLGEKVFQVFNIIFMLFIMSTIILPLLNIISISLSNSQAVISNSVGLFPKGFQLGAYKKIIMDEVFLRAFLNTVGITVIGSFLSILVITMAAYALSKEFYGKKAITYYLIVTMYFAGGLIPTYLLISNYLHMGNSYLPYFLPFLVNVFYIIIVRTQIEAIPPSLMDAAQIDGANEYQTMFLIVLPVLAPTIAAISMFVALNKWNTWFPVLLYTNKKELWTLQYFLRAMVFDKLLAAMSNVTAETDIIISPINFQMAAIVLVALPIVSIYPFVQKYFVKGIISGAVKG